MFWVLDNCRAGKIVKYRPRTPASEDGKEDKCGIRTSPAVRGDSGVVCGRHRSIYVVVIGSACKGFVANSQERSTGIHILEVPSTS